MKFIEAKDYDHMSRLAANIISAQVILKSNCVLGLATGSTPLGTYRQLIEWYEKGDIDFKDVTTVNLDEYRGLAPANDQSYHYFMYHNFFSHININMHNTYIPDGLEKDDQKACRDYENVIRYLGGVDLQLLGLGPNGHIGFNEPADYFERETHLVDLSQSTIDANSRFFESIEEVPKQAYTMGMKTIMQARKIVLVVSGKAKAETVRESFEGPITSKVPASLLQIHHDVTIIGDTEAFSLLNNI